MRSVFKSNFCFIFVLLVCYKIKLCNCFQVVTLMMFVHKQSVVIGCKDKTKNGKYKIFQQ